MSVYSKRATPEQRQAMEDYENICGFEVMCQDEFDQGKMTFAELWKYNVTWLYDVYASVSNINIPFEDELNDERKDDAK